MDCRFVFKAGGMALLALALFGCLPLDKDEEREKKFLPLYEAAMQAQRYCDAKEISDRRFEYVDEPDIDRKKQLKNIFAWKERGERAHSGCMRERQAEIRKGLPKLKDMQFLMEELRHLNIEVVPGSWRDSPDNVKCVIDMKISNGSSRVVSALKFAGEVRRAEFGGTEISAIVPFEKPIMPGEERIITACVSGQMIKGIFKYEDDKYPIPLFLAEATIPDYGVATNYLDWALGGGERVEEKIRLLEQELASLDKELANEKR